MHGHILFIFLRNVSIPRVNCVRTLYCTDTYSFDFNRKLFFCHKIKTFNIHCIKINQQSPRIMTNPVQYCLSPREISELPISRKEDNHPSRQRLGYHLFLGYYFSKYRELLPAEKHASFLDDDSSFDSTDDPPVLHASQVMRHAGQSWRDLPDSQKNAWNLRASLLNNRPIPGHLNRLPLTIRCDGVEQNTKCAIEVDWLHFCKVMKRSVTKSPPRSHAGLYVNFGGVRTPLSNKSYHSMYLSYIVRIAIFGKYYERLKKNEIIYQTSLVTVIHIASLERMKNLFCLGGLSSVLFCDKERTMEHSTCGKLYLEINGREMNGYIIKSNQRNLTVQLENNERIETRCPKWDNESLEYKYSTLATNYTITSYQPNMFSISSSTGQFKYLINRFTTDNDNDIVTNFIS